MRTRQLMQRVGRAGVKLCPDEKLRRHIKFSLALNLVAYTTVLLLVSHGGLSDWWANTAVSKGMAPAWLAVNTLALTGRLIPTRGQVAKWLAYWMPSAALGAVVLAFVIAKFGLGSLEARAVVGMMLFPLDHVVKRFIVFARQVRATNFLRKVFVPFRRAYLRLKTAIA